MTDERKAEDIIDVEYLPEGGEVIHEGLNDTLSLQHGYNENHSLCGEAGHYCPTGEHDDNPYASDLI